VNSNTTTLGETLKYFEEEIGGLYPDLEFRSIRRILFEKIANIKAVDLFLKPQLEISKETFDKIVEITQRLKNYEPLQYILGNVEFLGLNLRITPAVFIPRPETEELADWIIKNHKFNENRILDIGTGSGCLAIALDKLMVHSQTDGIDISDEALAIAEENSYMNESIVNFFNYNILEGLNGPNSNLFKEYYDIIVSNPPYVTESEKSQMQRNVLDYEPGNAIFVPDDDPLVFYRAIADFARIKLEWGGFLYLEINPLFHKEIMKMLTLKGYRNVQLRNDLSGKPRMIRAQIKLFRKGDNPELEKFRQL
jgi:release factor glutamine methyltransferase